MLNDLPGFALEALIAGTAALVTVCTLRQPVRAMFGARAAYRLWLLVPAVILAVAAPRVTISTAPLPAVVAVEATGATSAANAPATSPRTADYTPDPANLTLPLLILLWAAGAGAYIALLLAGHRRFLRQIGKLRPERRAEGRVFHAGTPDVGPALIGAIRPRIVLPADFTERFTRDEQTVVIAHERVHLSRGDAQVNLLAALACALLWFHPLVHIAARLLRIDQELACDEAVVARHPHARRSYAEAMLKTQLVGTPVPLGCHWFCGRKSELRDRIARLTLRSSRLRNLAGGAFGLLLVSGGAAAAWAAQPPVVRLVPQEAGTGGSLIQALVDGRADEARALIEAGADVNAVNSGDGSPLILAAREGEAELVRLLLERGADPNLAVQGDGNPLIMAAANGHLDIVRRLVTAGADVNLTVMAPRYGQSDERRSPLGMARQNDHREIARFLIAQGARA